MPEVGIVMKLHDEISQGLKTIAGNAKAFDKTLDELEAEFKKLGDTQSSLVNKQTALKKELEASSVKVSEARKAYRKLKDEASKGALDDAIDEQAQLRQELAKTESDLRASARTYDELYRSALNAAKGFQKAEEGSHSAAQGIKEDAHSLEGLSGDSGILDKLGKSGLTRLLGDAVSNASGAYLESLLGQPSATLVEDTLSGVAQGASMGMTMGSVFGVPGIAIGALAGGAAGALNGITAVGQAKDDTFKSYVQENVEGQLDEMDSIRASGSTTAGQREQDQLAFAQRFGSDEAAREYLDQVKAMAVNTNYSYDEITGYSKSLLNTYSAEETFGVLRDLSDATAGLNLDSSDVNAFIKGLSNMRTTGKVTREYLNYYAERGLDVYDALSRSTGADKSEIADMVSKGEIGGSDAAQSILDYIQAEFGGLSEKLAGTYDAMVDNLGDAEANLNAMMGEGYNEARKAGVQAQSDWLESEELAEAYKSIGAWKAELENARERYIREAVDEAISSEEYKAAEAEGDAAEMGRIIMQAKIDGMNEYNENEGKDEVLRQELALIEGVRNDAALNDSYWNAGYTLGQELSKGLASSMAEGSAGLFSPPEKSISGGRAAHEVGGTIRRGRAHAFGLDRVPYDGYPALLHEGERVLTARQAREQDQERDRMPDLRLIQERMPPSGDGSGGTGASTLLQVTVSGNTFGAGLDAEAVAQAIADEFLLQIQAGGGRV